MTGSIPALNLSEHGPVAVLTVLTTEVDSEFEAAFWTEVERQLRDYLKGKIIVDLTPVTFMSSAPMGTLVALNKRVKEAGGTLVICGVSKNIMGTLKVLHLDRVFTIMEDLESALTHLH